MTIEEIKLVEKSDKLTGKEKTKQEASDKLFENMSESPKIKEFLDNFCTDEEIKGEIIKDFGKFPLICKLIIENLTEDEKIADLQKALQNQQEASKNMEEEKLNEIAKTMGDVVVEIVKNDSNARDFLIERDTSTTTFEEKKEILQKITEKFSEAFVIKSPKLYTDGVNIPGLGMPSFIKVDGKEMNNTGNILGQLVHEYTHYLQYKGKTSNQKYVKQSRNYYVLPMYDGELRNLTDKIYDNSLMEKEAEYTRKAAREYVINNLKNDFL